MKAVSVIIPVYCVEAYIEECLVSVLNQTLKDIEIICVNDGTPDHSMEIVKKYAEKDDRIVIVNKENGGLSSARNAGLRVATGKYVYFLDSDDYILENALEKLYTISEENELDSIFFDADSFFEKEELKEEKKSYVEYYHRDNACADILPGGEFLQVMSDGGNWRPSVCIQMNRRNLLINNNIWFEEGIIHEDNLFSFQVSLYSKAAMHLPERFFQRRLREASIMTTKTAMNSAYGYLQCIKKGIKELCDMQIDKELQGAYIGDLARMANAAAKTMSGMPLEELENAEMEKMEDNIYFHLMIKDQAKIIKKNKELKRKIKKLQKKNKKLKNSMEYKIGRIITKIPRKIRKWFLKK